MASDGRRFVIKISPQRNLVERLGQRQLLAAGRAGNLRGKRMVDQNELLQHQDFERRDIDCHLTLTAISEGERNLWNYSLAATLSTQLLLPFWRFIVAHGYFNEMPPATTNIS